jgi:hypothetical protein
MEEEHIPLELERKPNAENLNEINEMHNEARKAFYNKEKEDEDIAKLQQSILEETKNRATDLEIGKSNTTTFTPDKSSVKPYTIRTTVIAGLMSLFSILPHQSKAEGGDTKKDKEPVKKEASAPVKEKKEVAAHISAKFENISDQIKTDWNQYIDWLELKGLKGSSQLDHGGLAKEMMKQFIAEHPGTTLGQGMVQSIQEALKDYQAKINELERLAELKGKTIISGAKKGEVNVIMADLDNIKSDGWVGMVTSKFKFPGYIMTIKEQDKVTGQTIVKTINKGFATPTIEEGTK